MAFMPPVTAPVIEAVVRKFDRGELCARYSKEQLIEMHIKVLGCKPRTAMVKWEIAERLRRHYHQLDRAAAFCLGD